MRPLAPGSAVWQRLQQLADAGEGHDLPKLFRAEPDREQRYTRSAAGLRLDFSRQRITDVVFAELLRLADVIELRERIEQMWRGDRINTTEDRAVLHVALRQASGDAIGGPAIEAMVLQERERVLRFADAIRPRGEFEDVINLGNGCSVLGPKIIVDTFGHHSKPE